MRRVIAWTVTMLLLALILLLSKPEYHSWILASWVGLAWALGMLVYSAQGRARELQAEKDKWWREKGELEHKLHVAEWRCAEWSTRALSAERAAGISRDGLEDL